MTSMQAAMIRWNWRSDLATSNDLCMNAKSVSL